MQFKETIQLDLRLRDRPGQLAAVLDAAASAGVKLLAVVGNTDHHRAILNVIAEDPAAEGILRPLALELWKWPCFLVGVEEGPVLLAGVARHLGDAGVNIRSLAVISRSGGLVTYALTFDDAAAARRALETFPGGSSP